MGHTTGRWTGHQLCPGHQRQPSGHHGPCWTTVPALPQSSVVGADWCYLAIAITEFNLSALSAAYTQGDAFSDVVIERWLMSTGQPENP